MADQEDSLEISLNRATNPSMRELDMELVTSFCDLVNKQLEGPQISVRLIAHKIQSPQEKEAEYALATLETCVKHCGHYFHQEIGKFRFLNEVIKVISPKYLGNRTSDKIKKKCIEILYSWKMGLPHEQKIGEAYSMLKAQGIVKVDPTYIDHKTVCFTPPMPRRADFEDEEKAKVLNRLLKSKNPEDLQAANRLIKNMVKDDVLRSEKVSKRINELQTINNNVQLLQEMIQNYSTSSSSKSDKEMMKELYESLEKLRPNLFRLASDTDEKDNDGISEILQANDCVMKVMSLYKVQIEGAKDERDVSSLLDLSNDPNKATQPPQTDQNPPSSSSTLLQQQFEALGLSTGSDSNTIPTSNSNSSALSDFGDIFNSMPSQATLQTIPHVPSVNNSQSLFNTNPTTAMGLFQPLNQQQMMAQRQQMMSQQQTLASQQQQMMMAQQQTMASQQRQAFGASGPNTMMMSGLPPPMSASGTSPAPSPAPSLQPQIPTQPKPVMSDLDMLGQSLLQQTLGTKEQTVAPKNTTGMTLNQLASLSSSPATTTTTTAITTSLLDLSVPVFTPPATINTVTSNGIGGSPSKTIDIQPLTDVTVPLESIKPGDHQPVAVLDKNNVKILLHIGKDKPRDDVIVMVVSTLSTSPNQIKNFVFQTAVPKIMKVKLQPPSANTLPAFNPILPPTAITQVMLLANPRKEKVRLKYKVTYTMNEENVTEMGEVDTIPVH